VQHSSCSIRRRACHTDDFKHDAVLVRGDGGDSNGSRVGEKEDCHGVAENVMFGQMAPMGTGSFEVALDIDMFKDAIVDHCLPVQSMLAAQVDGDMSHMMPGQVAMSSYDTNTPGWDQHAFKADSAASSPLAVNSGEDPANFSFLGYGQSPRAGGMSPGGPGYSPSSPNVYSLTSPYVPQSRFAGATSLFGTSLYATSPFYDRGGRGGPTSPTYSPTSLHLISPRPAILQRVRDTLPPRHLSLQLRPVIAHNPHPSA
jgi:DNA-directed RNA polymerase II subunit RPB1